MSAAGQRVSVPPAAKLPRTLTDAERDVYISIADVLCPSKVGIESPSRQGEFVTMLGIALAARADAFEVIVQQLASAQRADDLGVWLRDLHDREQAAFQALSTVAAGAYLMVPAVRAALRYPGQPRSLPRHDEAADDIGDGILDPVLERGHFYVPTPGTKPQSR